MQFYECNFILENLQYNDKWEWERWRQNTYYTIAPNLKNKVSISEFIPLPWDDNETKELKKEDIEISNEDVERLKKKAAQYTINDITE